MANKVYKRKYQDRFVVGTNATHALQLAKCDRQEFARCYQDAGKTLAKPGEYESAMDLASAERQRA